MGLLRKRIHGVHLILDCNAVIIPVPRRHGRVGLVLRARGRVIFGRRGGWLARARRALQLCRHAADAAVRSLSFIPLFVNILF